MTNDDRFKLLFGPYQTPRLKYGDVVTCEVRGRVKIVGLTEARIPWPKGRKGKRPRPTRLIKRSRCIRHRRLGEFRKGIHR